MTATADPILYEERGQIVIITLNRPEKLNAINMAMRNALFEALARFEGDDDKRVAVLTGAGERAFSAGRDLSEDAPPQMATFLPVIGDNVKVSKPVIAAVNGVAYGAGMVFTMMCDIVVANEETRLALSEAKVGRAPAIGCWLYGMMPPKIALELLMTGNPISARRAHEIGFINHIVPAAEVLPKALSIAEDILACAPLVVTAARQSIYLASEMGRTAALRTAVHVYEPAYRSEDTLEGWQAFREKRKPVWKNR